MPTGAQREGNAVLSPGRNLGPAARVALLTLDAYRVMLSPWLGAVCRFEPSCSRYASAAIERHGILRGGRMALRRLARCHPLGGCGYDPVP